MEEYIEKDKMIAVLSASIDQLVSLFFQQQEQSRQTESPVPITPHDQRADQTPTDASKHSEQSDVDIFADCDKLIQAEKSATTKDDGQTSFIPPKRPKRNRKLFKASEQAILEAEFQKSSQWSKELTKILSERLGVKRLKIYKWNYDRQKREAQAQLDSLCDLMDYATSTCSSLP